MSLQDDVATTFHNPSEACPAPTWTALDLIRVESTSNAYYSKPLATLLVLKANISSHWLNNDGADSDENQFTNEVARSNGAQSAGIANQDLASDTNTRQIIDMYVRGCWRSNKRRIECSRSPRKRFDDLRMILRVEHV